MVDSLDKQIQNKKELIHLASGGEGIIIYLCGVYQLDLTNTYQLYSYKGAVLRFFCTS